MAESNSSDLIKVTGRIESKQGKKKFVVQKYITYTLRESGCRWLRCLKWYLASLQSILQIEIECLKSIPGYQIEKEIMMT